ncbi:MAG: D-sedoheptulose 7-phosphate isomerase [Deltaproteobacteria bacterium]|nr:D-sedoheptulose 7-phosphate isomerase [Deltaproteobacteria bacterium]
MEESIRVKQEFLANAPLIESAAKTVAECFKRGGKLLICGNGGSAADSQHLAAEFMGRYKNERRALPAIALSTDSSFVTAWANDYSYETIFARQVEGLGKEDDVFIGLSTSGNSKNVALAAQKARQLKMKVITLTGNKGGALKELSDIQINVSSSVTARIQESHLLAYHIICELIDREFSE